MVTRMASQVGNRFLRHGPPGMVTHVTAAVQHGGHPLGTSQHGQCMPGAVLCSVQHILGLREPTWARRTFHRNKVLQPAQLFEELLEGAGAFVAWRVQM